MEQTIEELTAQRDQLLKEIETLDTVLRQPVGPLDAGGVRNFTDAMVQRQQAQKSLDELDKQIKLKEKEAQTAEDAAQYDDLTAQRAEVQKDLETYDKVLKRKAET